MNVLPALTDYLQQHATNYRWSISDSTTVNGHIAIEGRGSTDLADIRILIIQQDDIILMSLAPTAPHDGVKTYTSVDLCDQQFLEKLLQTITDWTGQVDSTIRAKPFNP